MSAQWSFTHCSNFVLAVSIAKIVVVFLLWNVDQRDDGSCLISGVTSFAPRTVAVASPIRNRRIWRHPSESTIATKLYAESTTGSRYLCLLEDYETTIGPYFFALFDQLFEQTNHDKRIVAFLTTQKDLDDLCKNDTSNRNTTKALLESRLENMKSSLDLDVPPEVFVLEDWDPLALEERFPFPSSAEKRDRFNPEDNPTIVWLYGSQNAFYTRHLLRTSGFDRWIQEHCASSTTPQSGFDNCVFVGEGTGALCVGATMDAAKARKENPNGAPELQFYGLQLLGEDEGKGVVFIEKEEDKCESIIKQYPEIQVYAEEEVFVWAQPPLQEGEEPQLATNFVMAPNRRGTIVKFARSDPLPPVIIRSNEETEGVACYGEPSIDPSRTMQAGTIGDSEWWE